jgi:hypothetical protein
MTAIAIPSLRMAASFSARLPSEKAPIQFLSQGFLYSLKPGAIVWLQTSQKEAKRMGINAAHFVMRTD